MLYTVIIHAPGTTADASQTGLEFCRALLHRGHQLARVFFYHDGVYNALAGRVAPQDESDVTDGWRTFHEESGVELAVCIAAALRRGILDAAESARYAKGSATADDAFEIVGLGQMIDAAARSDRVITFGNPA